MWVEFVVGSLLCSERFFSRFSGFPLSSKNNIAKFQFFQWWSTKKHSLDVLSLNRYCHYQTRSKVFQNVWNTRKRVVYDFCCLWHLIYEWLVWDIQFFIVIPKAWFLYNHQHRLDRLGLLKLYSGDQDDYMKTPLMRRSRSGFNLNNQGNQALGAGVQIYFSPCCFKFWSLK